MPLVEVQGTNQNLGIASWVFIARRYDKPPPFPKAPTEKEPLLVTRLVPTRSGTAPAKPTGSRPGRTRRTAAEPSSGCMSTKGVEEGIKGREPHESATFAPQLPRLHSISRMRRPRVRLTSASDVCRARALKIACGSTKKHGPKA